MTDWTNAHYADGPAVAAWCVAHGLNSLNDALARAIRRWHHGDRAGLATLDAHLTARGYHLSELPDEVWRRDPIVERLEAGAGVKAVAREFGLTPPTVRFHRERYSLAGAA